MYSTVYDSIVLDINICLMNCVIDDGYVPLNRKDMAVDRMIHKITSIHKNPGGRGYGIGQAPDTDSRGKSDSGWKGCPTYIGVTASPGNPTWSPDVSGCPEPAKSSVKAPAAVMKRTPAPCELRTPRPAIICPDPVPLGIRAPSVGNIVGNPYVAASAMVYPDSVRIEIVVKIGTI